MLSVLAFEDRPRVLACPTRSSQVKARSSQVMSCQVRSSQVRSRSCQVEKVRSGCPGPDQGSSCTEPRYSSCSDGSGGRREEGGRAFQAQTGQRAEKGLQRAGGWNAPSVCHHIHSGECDAERQARSPLNTFPWRRSVRCRQPSINSWQQQQASKQAVHQVRAS